jgi:3-oxoacyl-[acyl-carrier-protein] synthase-3
MDILATIINKAKEVFDDITLSESTSFQLAQGYDSMVMVQFLIELEEEFGVLLTESEIFGDSNSLELAEIIDRFLQKTSRYLPEQVIFNEQLEQFPAKYRQLISEKAGIVSRCHASAEDCTSDLGARAVKGLLDKAGLSPSSIQALICATSSPDRIQPATATRIQHLSDLKNAFVFDINAVCSGAVYALFLAQTMINSGLDNVIVVAAEMYSRLLNHKDITTYPYFGDGAGAALISRQGRFHLKDFVLYSDGSRADLIQIPGGGTMLPAPKVVRSKDYYFTMVGSEVFKFACEKGTEVIAELQERNSIIPDRVIAHQANIRIISEIARRSLLGQDKFYINLNRLGNIAGASVLIALDECLEKHPEDQNLFLVVFGGGLTWGGAYLQAT